VREERPFFPFSQFHTHEGRKKLPREREREREQRKKEKAGRSLSLSLSRLDERHSSTENIKRTTVPFMTLCAGG
jgi:hypothetical protein